MIKRPQYARCSAHCCEPRYPAEAGAAGTWPFDPGSRSDAQGLETATGEQLREIEIDPPGFGLHFPALDADLYIPALLEGFFGSKRWMAARLGELGGKARSAAKARASRANGRMGGRPKKVATAA
jgi:hypothetical protein